MLNAQAAERLTPDALSKFPALKNKRYLTFGGRQGGGKLFSRDQSAEAAAYN